MCFICRILSIAVFHIKMSLFRLSSMSNSYRSTKMTRNNIILFNKRDKLQMKQDVETEYCRYRSLQRSLTNILFITDNLVIQVGVMNDCIQRNALNKCNGHVATAKAYIQTNEGFS